MTYLNWLAQQDLETCTFKSAYEAGAASRDAEIQRLQFALADSEALELGTAEHCDQLRAHINDLREAMGLLEKYVAYNGDTWVQKEARNALSTTPEQSLAAYRNKVIEECAKKLEQQHTWITAVSASSLLRAMKEQST